MTVKIQLNRAGVRQLLRSQQVQAELKRHADRIAATAGPGFEVEEFVGKNRARATIRPTTIEARIAESAHQVLTQAVKGG